MKIQKLITAFIRENHFPPNNLEIAQMIIEAKDELIIALDIDGTITARPEFFAKFSREARAQGHRVVLLTSRSREVVEESLEEVRGYGVEFDDYYFLPESSERPDGDFPSELNWFEKQIWQKAEYCRDRGVDVFYEDCSKTIALVEKYSPGTKVIPVT